MANTTNATRMQFDATVDEMKGRLRESWGVLTDDDVDRADGQWDQMISTIRQKTGESLETVTTKVDGMIDSLQDVGSSDDES